MADSEGMQEMVEVDPLTDDELLEMREIFNRQREYEISSGFPYSPQETADLEDLGIDATRRTREAHSALQQVRWLEAGENLEWVLEETRCFVTEQQELALEVGAIVFPYDLEKISVRSHGDRLTIPFIEWYTWVCTFDENSGYRAYSLEYFRRGDGGKRNGDGESEARPDELEHTETVEIGSVEFPRTRIAFSTANIKKMIVSKLIEKIMHGNVGAHVATGLPIWLALKTAVCTESHPIHTLLREQGFTIDYSNPSGFKTEGVCNFKMCTTQINQLAHLKDEDTLTYTAVGKLCSSEALKNWPEYVANVDSILAKKEVW